MVWIYGGAFLQGESSIYNASGIITKSVIRVSAIIHSRCAAVSFPSPMPQGTPVVYVSINYRIGPFGFPQGNEADQRGAVNLGLKDQLAGLQWVQKHISAFGGDPSKVSIQTTDLTASDCRYILGDDLRTECRCDIDWAPVPQLRP